MDNADAICIGMKVIERKTKFVKDKHFFSKKSPAAHTAGRFA